MWIVYLMPPIDFGFDALLTVDEVRERIEEQRTYGNERSIFYHMTDFDKNFRTVMSLAKKVGWEGDMRGEPYVFWLPQDCSMVYGFVWKQENNGDTFVGSRIRLPNIEQIINKRDMISETI